MFDFGFWELSLIALIALVVLGPERLPGVARTAGHWIGRARRMISDVKADIDREIRNAEIQEVASIRKDIEETGREVSSTVSGMSEKAEKARKDLDITEAIQGSADSMGKGSESTDTDSDGKK